MEKIRAFFPQTLDTFFNFQKTLAKVFPFPSSCIPVSVAEYAWIYLNIPKYLCKNWKLFWQGSGYAWSSYMFNKLLKMLWVLNVAGFWIWFSCICKGYTEFWMSECLAISLNNFWIFLNMLNLLNVPYVWQCLNKLFRLCQGSQYASSS